jgi:hypothetical protein
MRLLRPLDFFPKVHARSSNKLRRFIARAFIWWHFICWTLSNKTPLGTYSSPSRLEHSTKELSISLASSCISEVAWQAPKIRVQCRLYVVATSKDIVLNAPFLMCKWFNSSMRSRTSVRDRSSEHAQHTTAQYYKVSELGLLPQETSLLPRQHSRSDHSKNLVGPWACSGWSRP